MASEHESSRRRRASRSRREISILCYFFTTMKILPEKEKKSSLCSFNFHIRDCTTTFKTPSFLEYFYTYVFAVIRVNKVAYTIKYTGQSDSALFACIMQIY